MYSFIKQLEYAVSKSQYVGEGQKLKVVSKVRLAIEQIFGRQTLTVTQKRYRGATYLYNRIQQVRQYDGMEFPDSLSKLFPIYVHQLIVRLWLSFTASTVQSR